jgi:hypothetical protein
MLAFSSHLAPDTRTSPKGKTCCVEDSCSSGAPQRLAWLAGRPQPVHERPRRDPGIRPVSCSSPVSSFRSGSEGPEHERGEWSRHSDSNRGPAVYELDRPQRCGMSVEWRAYGAQLAGLRSELARWIPASASQGRAVVLSIVLAICLKWGAAGPLRALQTESGDDPPQPLTLRRSRQGRSACDIRPGDIARLAREPLDLLPAHLRVVP